MPDGRSPADAPPGAPARPRRSVANEDGLRTLGDQMRESVAPARRRGRPAPPAEPGWDLPADDGGPHDGLDGGPHDGGLGGGLGGGDFDGDGLDGDGARALYPDPRDPRGRRRRRSGKPKMRRWTKALLIFGAVVVLLFGAAAAYLGYLNSLIHRIKVLGLSAGATSGELANTQNILLVGSTSRCALKQQHIEYGLCSAGVTGVNSDVVMVLHLNAATRSVSILSIPRDLFVPNARTTGANKIDAALSQSPSQLVAAVEQDFGIPIQHYVELNFETFAGVVDALGGINMYFPEPVFDDYSGLTVTAPGCIHLDGVRALQVVRARHLQYKSPATTTSNYHYWPQEAESDLARIRRDHEFLRVLAAAVAHQGLGNPLTDRQIIQSVAPQLTVDGGFSATDMVNMALTFHSVNVGTAPQLTLPVRQSSSLHYYYKGYDYGNVEFPSQPQDQQAVDKVFGIAPGTDTMTGKPLPKPSSVTVSVMNGSGAYDQATSTSNALGALGFAMVGVGDVPSPGAASETVVYYASSASEPAAEAVARSMSGAVLLAQGPTKNGAQVTVVTGSDFSVNAPAAPAAGSGAAGSGESASPTAPGASAAGAAGAGQASSAGALAAEAAAPGRPIARFGRSGWTGTARHLPLVWGGDPTTGWGFDGLASALTQALSAGLSGIACFGTDIGGFFSLGDQRLDEELLIRWIQLGALMPLMRTKSDGVAIPPYRRPQVWDPEILPHWRRWARFHAGLVPYLLEAAAEYVRTGIPLMRHMCLVEGGPDRSDQYLLGPDLLVAPVLQPGAREREVGLPPGRWVDLWRDATLEGGRHVTVPAPLDEVPILVRAGARLPIA